MTPPITKEKALQNQWTIAYHRIVYAREHKRQCQCEDCTRHLEAVNDSGVEES